MSSGRSDSKKSSKSLQSRQNKENLRIPFTIAAVVVIVLIISGGAFFLAQKSTTNDSSISLANQSSHPVILYVNQGNALVSIDNYTSLLNYAKSNNFNTIFFQVYRSGELLFSQSNLTFFVNTAHVENLKIFFALYFTSSTQLIPVSIYGLGEDGINLDMSTLSDGAQSNLLSTLQQNYKGETAVTTTNFTTTLRPDLLILETYQSSDKQYIHSGIIASVEPLAISNKQDYETQYQYALAHSDGVMVFDYYGLLKTGY